MTHFLRARHAAILVGAGTAVADDPGLNCRLAECGGGGSSGRSGGSGSGSSGSGSSGSNDSNSSSGSGGGGGGGGGGSDVGEEKTGEKKVKERQEVMAEEKEKEKKGEKEKKKKEEKADEDDAGCVRQPRPVIVDPRGRWRVQRHSRVVRTALQGGGLAPWVVCAQGRRYPAAQRALLVDECGGKVLKVPVAPASAAAVPRHEREKKMDEEEEEEEEEKVDAVAAAAAAADTRLDWADIFACLAAHGITSVMVEGGARVINDLLHPANAGLVHAVIVTIAPVYLGRSGVGVSPDIPITTTTTTVASPEERSTIKPAATAAARLEQVTWKQLGQDMVMCGRIAHTD
jgi:riboflavin biosynthesis pyrimidine reductase